MQAVVAAQTKRKVAVIHGNLMVAGVAKAATNTIPIVFATVDDPLDAGLVSGYGHPGGNVTGVRMRAGDEPAKLIELLHELLPAAATFGVLMHPGGLTSAADKASIEAAAQSKGVRIRIRLVSDENQFETVFVDFAQANVDGVMVNGHRYFDLRRNDITALALRYRLPAVSLPREFAIAGGLASYGSDLNDSLRQAGVYVGRILKGENPADLPILQPTKFILAIKSTRPRSATVAARPRRRGDRVI
jgi:putative ABC transport system substrate-binding protein